MFEFDARRSTELLTDAQWLVPALPTQAVYINNCQWGLHGPIEAISNLVPEDQTTTNVFVHKTLAQQEIPKIWSEGYTFTDINMILLQSTV